jgi:GTPase SAR1 family protein
MAMINNEETVRKIKLIVLGDSGVGKTSIINYFNEQKFKPLERATLGATFLSTRYALSTG